jgi:hypothetical protein
VRLIDIAVPAAPLTAAHRAAPGLPSAPHAMRLRVRRARVYRSIRAAAIAVALIGVPGFGTAGVSTVDAASTCVTFVAARFDARGVDARNLNGEWVTIRNSCATTVSLVGWRIRDRDGHSYAFRSGARIGAGKSIKIHTGRGARTAGHMYMGRSRQLWTNRTWERAYLVDPSRTRVSIWPRTTVPTPPPPTSDGVWSVPFLTRQTSGAIRKTGNCDNLVIENLTFKDLGADVEAIHLENCHNVTIRANDFARVAQAITVLNSTDVRIEWNRYLDIQGPHERVGRHRGNFVQLVEVSRGYIGHNKGKGGDTEDIVSMYHSGGTSAAPFIIEFNHFEGTNWTSSSGSGIALGDGTSAYSIARNNTLLNVGQVGLFIAGGSNHKILDNTIYGERREGSNVGLYVWNQSSTPCSGQEVSGNRVFWTNASGSANPAWNAGNCGTIAGWSNNTWNAGLDPAQLHVGL